MTKNLTKEQLGQYAEMLGFKFEDVRSVTTAQLHSVLRHVFSAIAGSAVWEVIERRRITKADQPEGEQAPCHGTNSLRGGSPSRYGWQCMSKQHWSCDSFGARAYRSLCSAGISWCEVARRITRRLPDLEVLENMWPCRDQISKTKSACSRFGGSTDIRTDVVLLAHTRRN